MSVKNGVFTLPVTRIKNPCAGYLGYPLMKESLHQSTLYTLRIALLAKTSV